MARARKDSVPDMPLFDTDCSISTLLSIGGGGGGGGRNGRETQSRRELFSALGKRSSVPVAEEEAETEEDMSVLLVSAVECDLHELKLRLVVVERRVGAASPAAGEGGPALLAALLRAPLPASASSPGRAES